MVFLYSKGDVVALKKLKIEKEREGFPITSLREINMLLKSSHPNIVHVRVRLSGILFASVGSSSCTSIVVSCNTWPYYLINVYMYD